VLEVGSFRNKREHAEEGVKLFAQAMPDIVSALGGAGGTMDRSAGRTLLGLVLLVLVGSAAYLYISTGSWEEAVAKLRGMTGREWGDLFRPGDSEDKR
jgi:stage II sporulation protein P